MVNGSGVKNLHGMNGIYVSLQKPAKNRASSQSNSAQMKENILFHAKPRSREEYPFASPRPRVKICSFMKRTTHEIDKNPGKTVQVHT